VLHPPLNSYRSYHGPKTRVPLLRVTLVGGVSALDTVIRNPEGLQHGKATYVHIWNTTVSTNRVILSIIHNLPTLLTSG